MSRRAKQPVAGALALALVLAAPLAHAEDAPAPAPADDFWTELVAPHRAEIAVILEKASHNLSSAARTYSYFGARNVPDDATRSALLADAIGMLLYARQLAPDHAEVLALLASAAAEDGRTPLAIDALERLMASEPPERIQPSHHRRLGELYAASGREDQAAAQLRLAIGKGVGASSDDFTRATISLANLLAADGRNAEAIELLAGAAEGALMQLQYGSDINSMELVLALAVAYDKDQQISRAYEALEELTKQAQRSGQAPTGLVYYHIDTLAFTPPADRHYYLALLYEAEGHLIEARATWLAYIGAARAPAAIARARQHITAIDALLDPRRPRQAPPEPQLTGTGGAP